MSKIIKGIGIGSGVSLAKALILKEPNFKFEETSSCSLEEELKNYKETTDNVIKQIETLVSIATNKISPEKGEIFKAHLEMAKDEQIINEITELIKQGKTQAWSINEIFEKYKGIFENMESDYFKERASDIKDLKKRLLAQACSIKLPDLLLVNEECILIAHDLTPSETAMLNKQYIKGFATNIGGATSHSAIMAKSLEIPALVSLKNITSLTKDGELVGINAKTGEIAIDLNEEDIKNWSIKKQQSEQNKSELEKFKTAECVTKSGEKINIKGNIGNPKDITKVLEQGGKGVGLFRSEFLYMESTEWPTEEEQFQAYKSALEQAKQYEVTIRTLDIGGDKNLSYFTFPKEMNPFLGYRALRLSLDKTEIFNTQLRALLRASVYGKLKIMFPMVTTVDELRKAKETTKKIEEELKKEGHKISDDYQIGIMVEIPSTAILANVFAKEADFFSVGSNDLIQYTHAVDRMSEEINYLYQPNNPSILNLIKWAADGAIANNKEISVCGEMASNPISALLLIGLGIKSLSMNAASIPNIKRVISQITIDECKDLSNKAINLATEKEVLDLVHKFIDNKKLVY